VGILLETASRSELMGGWAGYGREIKVQETAWAGPAVRVASVRKKYTVGLKMAAGTWSALGSEKCCVLEVGRLEGGLERKETGGGGGERPV